MGSATRDELYDTDILTWSERQAALLRRLAAGERVNASIDWSNVIEEIESVGRSERQACESLLRQALVHVLKLHLAPTSEAAPHWRGEVIGFLADASDRFSPSMRQPLDLPRLFAKARRQVLASGAASAAANRLPETCPFTVDELLDDNVDIVALETKLRDHGSEA